MLARSLLVCGYALGISLIVLGVMGRRPVAAAVVRTANFTIECADAEVAQAVAEAAEGFRTSLWKEWLGEEPPGDWAYPAEILVEVGRMGPGGSTSFAFEAGETFGFEGHWQGSRERLLDSVVPHEVLHTVLACHFRRALPRAMDEGMCVSVEHESERNNWRQSIVAALKSGRAFRTSDLLAFTEYPEDYQTMYGQGASLVEYLLDLGERRDVVRCVERAFENGWPAAFRETYGHQDLTHLQESWLAWIKAGGGQVRTVGYNGAALTTVNGEGCQIINGQWVCPRQQQQQQIFQPQQQAPRREPLLPRTYAPRAATAGAAAGAAAAAAVKPCECGPKLAELGIRIAAIEGQLGGLAKKSELPQPPDLTGYAKVDQLPDVGQLATKGDVQQVAGAAAEEIEKSHGSLLSRIAGVAKAARGGVAAAANGGGLLGSLSTGGQLAALLGLSGIPAVGASLFAAFLFRRLGKRISSSVGGRSPATFPDY